MSEDWDDDEGTIEATAESASLVKKDGDIIITLPSWAIQNAIDSATERLVRAYTEKLNKAVSKAIDEVVNDAFRAEVAARAMKVAEAYLDQPRKKTNAYGEATGGTVTFAEMIPEMVTSYMGEIVDREGRSGGGYNREGIKRADWIIGKYVRTELDAATKKAATEVTEQARKVVANSVGRFIAEQMVPQIDVAKAGS